MKISSLLNSILFSALAFSICAQLIGQESKPPQRADFVSEASFIIGTYQPASRDHAPEAILAAAEKLFDALTPEQENSISHELDSTERRKWTNLPARADAGGARIGDMSAQQVKRTCDLMATMFSEQGYNKMRDIMIADDQLLKNGKPRPGFGTENFSIVVFGTPSATDAWAFQIDGHHVGVNLAIEGEKITMSPSFIGTQPHRYSIAGKSFVPLEHETNQAHQLINSLTDEQIKQAIVGPTRARIITGPGRDGRVPKTKGVACSTFTDEQKEILLGLISQWVNDLPKPQATKRLEQIKSEFDQMKFSWNGKQESGSDVSYMIQSPSLIIEYACQNLGGNPLDHLHSIYRDPTNEYGKQLK